MESSDAEAPHIEAGSLPAEAIPKARANCVGRWRMWGIPLKPSTDMGRLSAELSGAWNLKPYWGKPAVRNFGGAAGNVAMGAGLRPTLKCVELPPDPKVRAQYPTRQGTPCHDTVGGKHGGCIETPKRAHETTTVAALGTRRSADSLREPSRSVLMIWGAVCAKVQVRICGSPRGAIPWGHPARNCKSPPQPLAGFDVAAESGRQDGY